MNVLNKSSKELGKKDCEINSMEQGKKLCKKSTK